MPVLAIDPVEVQFALQHQACGLQQVRALVSWTAGQTAVLRCQGQPALLSEQVIKLPQIIKTDLCSCWLLEPRQFFGLLWRCWLGQEAEYAIAQTALWDLAYLLLNPLECTSQVLCVSCF